MSRISHKVWINIAALHLKSAKRIISILICEQEASYSQNNRCYFWQKKLCFYEFIAVQLQNLSTAGYCSMYSIFWSTKSQFYEIKTHNISLKGHSHKKLARWGTGWFSDRPFNSCKFSKCLKGQLHEIFDPRVFLINQPHLRLWFTG
jgi:hypothetical protein